MAYSMVSVYGMNADLGLLSYGQEGAGGAPQFYKPYSEETCRLMDREARQLVEGEYERVKALLRDKTAAVRALAARLGEQETLAYGELRAVLGDRPFGLKEEYRQFVTAGSTACREVGDSEPVPSPEP
mmetsp:Transcript_66679/g.189326  ORF Transcript_66679/g.189326 Transcript_66679/m.189326 type:complete len:128 (+) Transcript_66679:2-385(+)